MCSKAEKSKIQTLFLLVVPLILLTIYFSLSYRYAYFLARSNDYVRIWPWECRTFPDSCGRFTYSTPFFNKVKAQTLCKPLHVLTTQCRLNIFGPTYITRMDVDVIPL